MWWFYEYANEPHLHSLTPTLRSTRWWTTILRLALVHCSFKENILSNGVNLWICTWFVLKHIKNTTTLKTWFSTQGDFKRTYLFIYSQINKSTCLKTERDHTWLVTARRMQLFLHELGWLNQDERWQLHKFQML